MELDSKIQTVLVEGSGVDALLAALTIRRMLPGLNVILREQAGDDNPIGESTTPFLLNHLTGPCGIRVQDLFRLARPTMTLGFRYRWGLRGDFLRSFDASPSLTLPGASCEAGRVSAIDQESSFSVGEALMRARRVPPVQRAKGGVTGLQIKPERMADLLRRACQSTGVTFGDGVDADDVLVVRTHGEPDEDAEWIGESDLPIGHGCVTGLRRRANDRLNAFSTVETQEDGWSWRIEHEDLVGIGFAYDARHLDHDAARSWLRGKLGEPVGEIVTQRWRVGRHASPWSENGVVVGNAAGFVSPFTGIRLPLLVHEVQTLGRLLAETHSRPGQESRKLYNRIIGRARDEITDFAGLHLANSGREDSEFWVQAGKDASTGEHSGLLDLFRVAGPSGLIVNALPTVPGVLGIGSWVASFVGLGIPFAGQDEVSETDRTAWKQFTCELENRARKAQTHEQGLATARG